MQEQTYFLDNVTTLNKPSPSQIEILGSRRSEGNFSRHRPSHRVEKQPKRRHRNIHRHYGHGKTATERELVDSVKASGALSIRLVKLFTVTTIFLLCAYVAFDMFGVKKAECKMDAGNITVKNWFVFMYHDLFEISALCDVQSRISESKTHQVALEPTFYMEYLFCKDVTFYNTFMLSSLYGTATSLLVIYTLADLYGRKFAFCLACVITIVGLLLMFIPWKWMLIPGAFLLGFGYGSRFILLVLLLEICSDKTMYYFGFLTFIYFPLGSLILYVFMEVLLKWFYVAMINTITLFAMVIALAWWFTESPRWLLSTGNTEGAWETLRKYNKNVVQSANETEVDVKTTHNLKTIYKVLYKPMFRERIVVCFMAVFLDSMVPFSRLITFRKGLNIKSNEYIILMKAASDIIFLPAAVAIAIKLGRKKVTFMLLSIIAFLNGILFMRNNQLSELYVLPYVIFFYTTTYKALFITSRIYTMEIFPTAQRCSAFGLIYLGNVLGCIIQKHFQSYFLTFSPTFACMQVFLCSITSASLIMFLPPTTNNGLPDTMYDALYLQPVK